MIDCNLKAFSKLLSIKVEERLKAFFLQTHKSLVQEAVLILSKLFSHSDLKQSKVVKAFWRFWKSFCSCKYFFKAFSKLLSLWVEKQFKSFHVFKSFCVFGWIFFHANMSVVAWQWPTSSCRFHSMLTSHTVVKHKHFEAYVIDNCQMIAKTY